MGLTQKSSLLHGSCGLCLPQSERMIAHTVTLSRKNNSTHKLPPEYVDADDAAMSHEEHANPGDKAPRKELQPPPVKL